MKSKIIMMLVTAINVTSFSLFVTAQDSHRAAQIPLELTNKGIYDSLFYANDWRVEYYKKIQDFHKKSNIEYDVSGNWMSKMLKIGDRMPDIELGNVINNPAGVKRFSDLKGKLIILDFWNTTCGSCIANFPKISKLQEQFRDRVQFILVNRTETEEEIVKKMGKNISKLPKLLSVVSARHLTPYFPHGADPYHVWIDQSGIVKIIGRHENTYAEKIQNLLDGKEVISFNNEATKPVFNPQLPYAAVLGLEINQNQYNSFFTAYNKDYVPVGILTSSSNGKPNYVLNQPDTSTGSMRTTFINATVEQLYNSAFNSARSEADNILFSPHVGALYEVKDSLRYSWRYAEYRVDTSFFNTMFCYEQSYPKTISNTGACKMMAEDLNTYFGKLYGTYGRMEKRSLPGYVIVKLPGKNYNTLLSRSEDYKETRVTKYGKNFIKYQAIRLNEIFDDNLIKKLVDTNKKMIINESGIKADTKIDIEVPANASLADIKQALKPYGLNIIERNTEIELLVISDTKPK